MNKSRLNNGSKSKIETEAVALGPDKMLVYKRDTGGLCNLLNACE